MAENGDESSDEADDPFAEVDEADDEADDPDDDAPLADLAREVRERRAAAESGADAGADAGLDDDPFESVDVGEVDDETVWESFVEGETGPEERVGLGADVKEASAADDHVVPKREFCQQCPHFSEPPEATCTHEGTAIVEVVDSEDFRVRNCPIVAERRESRID